MKNRYPQGVAAGLAAAAVLALMSPARAQERVYLTKTEVEQLLIGKVQKHIKRDDGHSIRWDIRSNGYLYGTDQTTDFTDVAAWSIRENGGFCLKWRAALPNRCFYYFKDGDQYKIVAGLPEADGPHESAIPFEVNIK